MVVGAGRLDDQLLERRVVQVRELQQAQVGGVAEDALDQGQHEQDQERREDQPARERRHRLGACARRPEPAAEEREAGDQRHVAETDPQPRAQDARPTLCVRHAVGRQQGASQREERERQRASLEDAEERRGDHRIEERELRPETEPHQHRARRHRDGVAEGVHR